jgi:hypothetical protein
MTDGVGPFDIAFRLELTAAQMKVTHTALRSLMNDFGHEEHEIHTVIREVLDKLPSDHDMRAIDLTTEFARRRAAAA